jgi:CheY-like chemotaxis protein
MPTHTLAILVVDDCPDTVATYHDLFQFEGYDVRTAVNNDEVRTALDGWQPDVAILDLLMPRTDGLELARQLRAPGATRPVLVALTGLPAEMCRGRAQEAGFDHFFVKPAEPNEMLRLLHAYADSLANRR